MGYDRNYGSSMWDLINRHFKIQKIGVTVEIGTYLGHWAQGALNSLDIDKLFSVDSGKKGNWFKAISSWLGRVGSAAFDRAQYLKGTSEEWGRVFPLPIDLLFIDGAHTYEGVKVDLEIWYPKVKKGGLVICHDAQEPETLRGIQEYFDLHKLPFKKGPLGPIGKPEILCAWLIK